MIAFIAVVIYFASGSYISRWFTEIAEVQCGIFGVKFSFVSLWQNAAITHLQDSVISEYLLLLVHSQHLRYHAGEQTTVACPQ